MECILQPCTIGPAANVKAFVKNVSLIWHTLSSTRSDPIQLQKVIMHYGTNLTYRMPHKLWRVLTMVYYKQHNQISTLCPLPNPPKTTQHFRKCVCFHLQVKGCGAHPQLSPLGKAGGLSSVILTDPSEAVLPTFSPKDRSKSSFWNVEFFLEY
jgi:hypothetical protein